MKRLLHTKATNAFFPKTWALTHKAQLICHYIDRTFRQSREGGILTVLKNNWLNFYRNSLFWLWQICVLLLCLGSQVALAQQENLPCNALNSTPFIPPTITGTLSQTTSTSGVGTVYWESSAGCVLGLPLGCGSTRIPANVINSSTTDFARVNLAVGLGLSATMRVTEATNTYSAGNFAGYLIDNASLVSAGLLSAITVKTYNNGTLAETSSAGSLIGVSSTLVANKYEVGFYTTQPFDAIEITFNSVAGLAVTYDVYYPVVRKYCASPSLVCNTKTGLNKNATPAQSFATEIDYANTGISGVALATISNPESAISPSTTDFASVLFPVGIGSATLAVKDHATTYDAGHLVGFDIENVTALGVGLFNSTTITTYLNGVQRETASGSSLAISGGLLSSSGRQIVAFVTNMSFDEIKITLNQNGVSLGTTKIYNAVVQKFCAATIACNQTYSFNNPDYPVVIDGLLTGLSGVACVGCSVSNTDNLLTASTTDYATINVLAGLAASGAVAVQDVLYTYPAGTAAGFTIKDENSLLELNLLGSMTVSTYNNGVLQESKTANNLFNFTVTTQWTGLGSGAYNIGFIATLPFDEIRLSVGSLLSGLNTIRVYGAFVNTETSYGGSLICASTFNFNCATATSTGTFMANGTSGQLGNLTLLITGTTAGSAAFTVTGSGFTANAIIPLTAGQTSVTIPISYNGSGSAGSRTLTINALSATGTCTPSVTVVPDNSHCLTSLPTLLPLGSVLSIVDFCPKGSYNYYKSAGSSQDMLAINPNNNVFQPTNVVIDATVTGTNSQSSGGFTTAIAHRLISIEATGTHPINGGIKVRIYYNPSEFSTLPTANRRWFKHPAHTKANVLSNLTATGLTNATFLTPDSVGTENGLSFVEFFNIQNFSTFGYMGSQAPEDCTNGIDDDGDGLIDCDDPDCGKPIITSIVKTNPAISSCPNLNDGSITITATGSNLRYSKNTGTTWQVSNAFNGLTAGTTTIRIQDSVSTCLIDTTIVLTAPTCNEAPTITSATTANFAENGTGTAYTVIANDADAGQTKTYSFETGGADNALFSINPTTGAVTFNTSPDFENPTDASNDNVYNIKIKVCDDGTPQLCVIQDVAITVTNVADTEICNNQIDDDGDGKIDGEDPDCTEPACSNTTGTITGTIAGQNTNASFTQKYVLTDSTGKILQILNTPSVSGLSAGKYRFYAVNYETASGITGLTANQNISGVTGTCVNISLPLLYKICVGTEICNNQLDDDGDGKIDGEDPDCAEPACDNTTGTITATIAGQNTGAGFTQKYVLTDSTGKILQILTTPSVSGLSAGKYRFYAVNYETASGITGLTANQNITAVTGTCVNISLPLLYKICMLPCSVINIPNISKTNPSVTSCPVLNDGTVTITATGSNLRYSRDSGATWQTSNIFNNLIAGTVLIRVQDSVGLCYKDTSIVLNAPLCCATPTVGGTTSLVGGQTLCDVYNADRIAVSGKTGNVLKWQTSTNGGTSWTDIPFTGDTLSFNNAINNQKYRVLISNGTYCSNDTSTVTTIQTEPYACCNSTDGSISATYGGFSTDPSHTNKFALTDTTGRILQITNTLSVGTPKVQYSNLNTGWYYIYAITYDSLGYVRGLNVGSDIDTLNGECLLKTAPIPYKVCRGAKLEHSVEVSASTVCLNGISDYTLIVRNTSTNPARNVVISDTLATGLVFLVDTVQLTGGATYSANTVPATNATGVLQWGSFDIPAGDSVIITAIFKVANTAMAGIFHNSLGSISTQDTIVPFIGNLAANTSDDLTVSTTGDCANGGQSIACSPSFYQIFTQNRSTKFAQLNVPTLSYTVVGSGPRGMNAIGVNEKTGFAYGVLNVSGMTRFIKIGANNTVFDMGVNLGSPFIIAGDCDTSGYWWAKHGNQFLKVKLSDNSQIHYTPTGSAVWGADMVFRRVDKKFYSANGTTLSIYDPLSNNVSTLTLTGDVTTNGSGTYGGQWAGADGEIYISSNVSGKIYKVDVATGATSLIITTAGGMSVNDGYYCPDAIRALGDKDKDGIINYTDIDDDNDGILDTTEGMVDTDNDGITNDFDLDSDNDGIPDIIESQTTAGFMIPSGTLTATGLWNNYGTGTTPIDTDNDLIPDYLDANSDNEGGTDTFEGALILSNNDSDKDGLDDAIDDNDTAFGSPHAGITNVLTQYPNTGTQTDWRNSLPTTPSVSGTNLTVWQDTTISLCLPIADNNPLHTFIPTLCGMPLHGSVSGLTVNNLTRQVCFNYTSDSLFIGQDSFCVRICNQSGYCDTASIKINIVAGCVTMQVKVLLEGAYETSTSKMTTILNQRGLLPGQTPIGQFAIATPKGQPYKGAPWSYAGTEGDTITTYPPTVTDWVLLTLRADTLSYTPLYRVAGWLHENGTITFSQGCIAIPNGSYFVLIEHRNHMGVLSYRKVSIENRVMNFDFTTADSYIRTNPPSFGQKLKGGKWTMYAGDGKKDTFTTNFDINFNDTQLWKGQSGTFDQYKFGDFNLDADVNFLDNQLWKINNGKYSGVPH